MQETEIIPSEHETMEFGGIGVNRGRDRDGSSSFGDTVQTPDSIFDF